jgi:hypothetical protein
MYIIIIQKILVRNLGLWSGNYLCNQCLSPLKLWVQITLMVTCTRYNIMWLNLSVTCGGSGVFSLDNPVSSTNKTYYHDLTELLLKVALNTIALTHTRESIMQVTDKLNHTVLYRVHLALAVFEFTTLVALGTDCIGSYKSDYYRSRPRRPLPIMLCLYFLYFRGL